MTTTGELARALMGTIGNDSNYLNCCKWLNDAYLLLASKVRLRHLRHVAELRTSASYSTGLVTIAQGSTILTGSMDADGTLPAWESTIGDLNAEYWAIRLGNVWYSVASIDSETQLTLTTAYADATLTNAGYTAVQRYHAGAADSQWFGDFTLPRLLLCLGKPISHDELNRLAPGRVYTASYPQVVAEVGADSHGYPLLELYPASASPELVTYIYWSIPADISNPSTVLPLKVAPLALKELALVYVYRNLKAEAYRAGKVEEGNSWRNDEMAQSTKNVSIINDAIRQNRGVDDLSIILNFSGIRAGGDIATARDLVYTNWTYPTHV